MKVVICPHCGNFERFKEWVVIHRYNHFIQKENGRILIELVKERQDDDMDSVITCEVCGYELEYELYHQLLDKYSETLFEEVS